jgi:hypothetical protein
MVKDYERKINADLLVYPAVKSTGTKCDLDHSGGRSVFYVTVGQMKHTKIIINDKVITPHVLRNLDLFSL